MLKLSVAAGRALLAACLLGVSLLPQQAWSHAVLMDSSPKARQQLDVAPKEVAVTFNESVGPIFFRIIDKAGAEVGKPAEIRLDGTRMLMTLGDSLPNGTYVMTYRVISADTHPVGATIPFSIGEPIGDLSGASAATAAPTSIWTAPVAVNRWLLYSMMLLAAGSALFVLLMPAAPSIADTALRVGRPTALVAAINYVLAIGMGGAEMLLGDGSALFGAAAWSRGFGSTLAPSAALGVPAMLLLFWACGKGATPPRAGALGLGAALGIASFLVTGHAATAPPVWLMATTVGVHLTCAAFWIGALWPLARSTQLLPLKDSGALMTAFSNRAAWAVGALVLSGLVISWTQVQSFGNLFGNDYGTGLIRKLVLFIILLAIAGLNKLWLTPALERGEPRAAGRIANTIRLELALYLLILLVAMTLTLATPPRAIVQSGAGGAAANPLAAAMADNASLRGSLQASGYTAEYELTPGRAGENMLMVTVKGADGKVLETIADLEIVPSLPSAGIGDIRIKASRQPGGMWHAMVQEMIIPGQWTLGLDVFVTDYDKVAMSGPVEIR
jgi:copper transport protein